MRLDERLALFPLGLLAQRRDGKVDKVATDLIWVFGPAGPVKIGFLVLHDLARKDPEGIELGVDEVVRLFHGILARGLGQTSNGKGSFRKNGSAAVPGLRVGPQDDAHLAIVGRRRFKDERKQMFVDALELLVGKRAQVVEVHLKRMRCIELADSKRTQRRWKSHIGMLFWSMKETGLAVTVEENAMGLR